MKRKVTTILALLLCAIITVTSICADTAYAAEKTPLKVTFKGKTVTLVKDINEKPAAPKFKTLKSKWGKPKTSMRENDFQYYEWKKGNSTICYNISNVPRSERMGCDRTYIRIDAYDKNIAINGVKVGMKQEKAEKILKKLSSNDNEFSDLNVRISWQCDNGKIFSITVELEDM